MALFTVAINADDREEMLTSHLVSFRINDGELKPSFLKADDPTKENVNKEKVIVPLET